MFSLISEAQKAITVLETTAPVVARLERPGHRGFDGVTEREGTSTGVRVCPTSAPTLAVGRSVGLLVRLSSTCPSVRPSVRPGGLSVWPSVCLSDCRYVFTSVRTSVQVFVCLYVLQSVRSVRPSFCSCRSSIHITVLPAVLVRTVVPSIPVRSSACPFARQSVRRSSLCLFVHPSGRLPDSFRSSVGPSFRSSGRPSFRLSF